ncbi:MAG TPA: DUF4870 domain-containing protein [Acidobacteriota bacterium]|nr:DUF4870 domain-containing protein [Acidobacteriota bacterium]
MTVNVLSPEERDARLWASLCHISSLLVFFGIPLGNILGPLVFWLIKRNEYSFVDDQGKEALNFQLSMTIYLLGGGLIILLSGFYLMVTGRGTSFLWTMGLPLSVLVILWALLLILLDVILVFVATIQASDGVAYRYPLALPFFR